MCTTMPGLCSAGIKPRASGMPDKHAATSPVFFFLFKKTNLVIIKSTSGVYKNAQLVYMAMWGYMYLDMDMEARGYWISCSIIFTSF